MTRQWRVLAGWPPLALVLAALCLAACGTSGPAAPAPGAQLAAGTPQSSSGWVTLNQNISVDQFSALDATKEPAGPQTISAQQAHSAAPFAFGVPAWAPAGFVLQDQAEVITSTAPSGFASVSLGWQNSQGATIELVVSRGNAGLGLAGASGASEALQVGGQPATLQHQTGFGADHLTLSWARGTLVYRLTADTGAATPADLVHMAESVS